MKDKADDLRLNVIGAGRVGTTIVRLAGRTAGIEIGDVVARDHGKARKVVDDTRQGRAVASLADADVADLWCLAVPDDALESVAADLARAGVGPASALHFSGYHPASVMAALDGWSLASAHPNFSFATSEAAAGRFAGTPVALEGDTDAVALARRVMEAFGATTFLIEASRKPLYHAAAVISNNFAVVLQALAREVWEEADVPEDVSGALSLSLLRAALGNLEDAQPGSALTGPAARGDRAVVEVEAMALTAWRPEVGALYDTLSVMASHLKRTGHTGG